MKLMIVRQSRPPASIITVTSTSTSTSTNTSTNTITITINIIISSITISITITIRTPVTPSRACALHHLGHDVFDLDVVDVILFIVCVPCGEFTKLAETRLAQNSLHYIKTFEFDT